MTHRSVNLKGFLEAFSEVEAVRNPSGLAQGPLGPQDTGSSRFHSPPTSSLQTLRLLLIRPGNVFTSTLSVPWRTSCVPFPLPCNSIYTTTCQCRCWVLGLVGPWTA